MPNIAHTLARAFPRSRDDGGCRKLSEIPDGVVAVLSSSEGAPGSQ